MMVVVSLGSNDRVPTALPTGSRPCLIAKGIVVTKSLGYTVIIALAYLRIFARTSATDLPPTEWSA